MREINVADITENVARLSEHSCHYLPEDVLAALLCNIASLPVAVNLMCWCDRHEEAIL